MAWSPSPFALTAITAGVVAAAAAAGILLQPTDRPVPAPRAPNVSIDVIAPLEPELAPGGLMEVGDLADGYRHRDYARQSDVAPSTYDVPDYDPPARVEPRPIERARVVAPAPAPRPAPVERSEPRRWPFGFDQPRPDYAAERRERMARLDDQRRIEDQRRLEEARERERRNERDAYYAARDDRARDAGPDRPPRVRERQWYRSDGVPVPGPGRGD